MLSRLLLLLIATGPGFAQAPPAMPQPTPPTPATPQYPSIVGGKDLSAWLKDLKDSPDNYIRELAAKTIISFGPAARGPALKPLCSRLAVEQDPGVRMNIIIMLGLLGADKPEDAKTICEALNGILLKSGVGSPVRLYATRALAPYGAAAAFTIPTLVNLYEDPAWETRQAIAYTLARIGRGTDPKKGPSISALNLMSKKLVTEETAVVRLEIAQSLLLLGVPPYKAEVQGDYERTIKPYIDAVEKQMAKETDPATKVWLMMTHMTYDARAFNDTTIGKIADQINQPDLGGRLAALRALALLGPQAKAAIPSMLNALKWTEPELLTEAIVAVASLKHEGKPAIPDLERIKAGTDEYLKNLATQAIEAINKAVPPPMPKK
jgi:HEAT repeat protein